MNNLHITKETNDLQKRIREELKYKGYTRKMRRINRFVGNIHFNKTIEYFQKGNVLFVIERDLENNIVSALLCYRYPNGEKEKKSIRLEEVLELA